MRAEGKGGRRYFVAEIAPATWQPNVDVYQTADAVVVLIELSGVAPDSVNLSVEGRTLRVSGARVPRFRTGSRQFVQLEIPQGAYERVVRLPAAVDGEAAEANYVDGLLEVIFPLSRPVRPIIGKPSTVRGGAESE